MLVEEVRISRSIMQRNYSHCPLKKRPVPPSAREERPAPLTYPYEDTDDNEPENLSTKPEDLSRTGNYPGKAASPAAEPTLLQPRRWAHSPAPTHLAPHAPLSPYLPPHLQTHLSTHLPAHLPVHLPARLPVHLPAHLPSHLPTHLPSHPPHLPPYPARPEPQHPAVPAEPYCSWSRPSPPYGAYQPSYPEYSGLSPRAACSPPAHSPPALSPVSLCSGPGSPGSPGAELSPPGSVSSDSGISAGSGPRRRREGAARYQCPDCGKSYSTYSGLSKHRQFHCAAAEGNLAKKSFGCKYCSKVYTSLGALKMHIRTHTLPCKCHLCGKAFSRPWLLQGHIRTHTGEKPFSCHHCRRAFADRSNLRAHLQTHSEVKKYSCASCSKTFSRMSLLGKHLEGGCPGYSPSAGPPSYDYGREELAAY